MHYKKKHDSKCIKYWNIGTKWKLNSKFNGNDVTF